MYASIPYALWLILSLKTLNILKYMALKLLFFTKYDIDNP